MSLLIDRIADVTYLDQPDPNENHVEITKRLLFVSEGIEQYTCVDENDNHYYLYESSISKIEFVLDEDEEMEFSHSRAFEVQKKMVHKLAEKVKSEALLIESQVTKLGGISDQKEVIESVIETLQKKSI